MRNYIIKNQTSIQIEKLDYLNWTKIVLFSSLQFGKIIGNMLGLVNSIYSKV